MKSNKEILQQLYISANDLMQLIPGLKLYKARMYISELIYEMKQEGMFIPTTKQRLASTKLAKKKLGIWEHKKRIMVCTHNSSNQSLENKSIIITT